MFFLCVARRQKITFFKKKKLNQRKCVFNWFAVKHNYLFFIRKEKKKRT